MVIDDRRRPVERDMRHHVMPALSAGFGEHIEVGFLNLPSVCAVAVSVVATLFPSFLFPGVRGAESAGQGRLRERLSSEMPPQRHGSRDQNGDLFLSFDPPSNRV